ncbi:hypothetical protein RRG08_033428 [Elysia crispata]|uniref:Uncharacterized protein n=1 Tax=Elysia crispata TaxID=231223 RepID=A0AAE1AV37_9GAST|nr:hypothetical protein RRG08_033428 [Elysia crispata]
MQRAQPGCRVLVGHTIKQITVLQEVLQVSETYHCSVCAGCDIKLMRALEYDSCCRQVAEQPVKTATGGRLGGSVQWPEPSYSRPQ